MGRPSTSKIHSYYKYDCNLRESLCKHCTSKIQVSKLFLTILSICNLKIPPSIYITTLLSGLPTFCQKTVYFLFNRLQNYKIIVNN